jgi:hypothetical protein
MMFLVNDGLRAIKTGKNSFGYLFLIFTSFIGYFLRYGKTQELRRKYSQPDTMSRIILTYKKLITSRGDKWLEKYDKLFQLVKRATSIKGSKKNRKGDK